jgi:hypothetical protein
VPKLNVADDPSLIRDYAVATLDFAINRTESAPCIRHTLAINWRVAMKVGGDIRSIICAISMGPARPPSL